MQHETELSRFIVQVKPGADVEEVAACMKTAGFSIDRIMPRLGYIGASGPRLLDASKLQGVASVREEGGFTAPPLGGKLPR